MNRAIARLIAGCSVALLAPLLWPLVSGRVFVFNDLSWFHLPMRHLYQQALNSGDSVLWTPSIFAGYYMHGEGQIGAFHPFHQLIYRLLPLGPAFNVELIANYVAAFAGMFWFFRRLAFSREVSLFGAMLFTFSSFNLLHHHHVNMVAVVAHLPWLLAAADVLIVDNRRRAQTLAVAAMALIFASEFLLGFPQAVWWNALVLAAFGLFRSSETGRWKRLLPCAAGVLIGILLGGIQLLPTADVVAHSERMDASREFAMSYSLHPINVLQLWSPYVFEAGAWTKVDPMWFHEYGLYSGALLTVALIWVWIRRDALPARRRLIGAATAFAAVGLLLAFGRYGGLAVLLSYLPVFRSLRAPARYVLLVQFALTILAAITVEDLIAIADRGRAAASRYMAVLWIPAALAVVTTLALNTGVLPYGPKTFSRAAVAAEGAAFVVAVTVLVFLAGRQVRWALGSLVVVTALDLGVLGIGYVYQEPPLTIKQLTRGIPAAPAPPAAPADSYAFAPLRGPFRTDLLVMRGYRLTSGYVGLFPAMYHPRDGDAAARLSGSKWNFQPDGTRQVFQGAVERVRLLDEQGQAAAGTASMVRDRPGHLVVDVVASGRRTLALTERFHDGWQATVDGVPLQMVQVEHDFLGCVVEGDGVRHVTFRFMPRSFVYGSAMSAIGAALVAGVLIIGLIGPRE